MFGRARAGLGDQPQQRRVQRIDPPAFDFDIIVGNATNGGYEPGAELKQAWATVTKDNSSRNRMGFAHPAVDKLLDKVEAAKTREELDVVVQALDRVLRAERITWTGRMRDTGVPSVPDQCREIPPCRLRERDATPLRFRQTTFLLDQ